MPKVVQSELVVIHHPPTRTSRFVQRFSVAHRSIYAAIGSCLASTRRKSTVWETCKHEMCTKEALERSQLEPASPHEPEQRHNGAQRDKRQCVGISPRPVQAVDIWHRAAFQFCPLENPAIRTNLKVYCSAMGSCEFDSSLGSQTPGKHACRVDLPARCKTP